MSDECPDVFVDKTPGYVLPFRGVWLYRVVWHGDVVPFFRWLVNKDFVPFFRAVVTNLHTLYYTNNLDAKGALAIPIGYTDKEG
jgi:hypothetical protein